MLHKRRNRFTEEWPQYSSLLINITVVICLVKAATNKEISLSDIAPPDYDYLHPPKNSSEPLPVNISILKLSLRSVDESDMSFSVIMEMMQSWLDYRLNYPTWATETYSVLDSSWIKKIWNPMLYFKNAVDGKLDNIITPSAFFWLNQNHTLFYYCRVILKLICEMDLKYFPHDKQSCGIQMSSSIYNEHDVFLYWKSMTENPHLLSRLQQFEISHLSRRNFLQPLTRTNYSCLELQVNLKRRTGYYLINVYIPTILIVIMSMLTFWIPPDAVPARITLGVTSLLTIITKQYQAAMPNVSYIVALNVWLSSCIGFVFFSLLEFAAVIAFSTSSKKVDKATEELDFMLPMVMLKTNGTWSVKNNWSKKPTIANKRQNISQFPKRLDYFSRVFFPSAFVAFALIYWYIYNSY